MSTVTISHASYLGAATVIQAKGHVQYMINGVCINPTGGGNDIVATDGHHLIKIHDDIGALSPIDHEYIVEFSTKQKRDLKKRGNQDKPVTLDFDANTMTLNGCTSPIEVIDGKFPDYNRIIPKVDGTLGGETPGFQLRMLVNFANVHKVLGEGSGIYGQHPIKLHAQGYTGGALVEFPSHRNVTGVLMPIQC